MSSLSPPRVVVADDSALMRSIVTSALHRAGVEVVGSARDGDEALALCERERPDAMTLDLAMPGLDGGSVAEQLSQSGHRIPVIVVSADRHGAERARALGAAGFLAKPFDLTALVTLIEKVAVPPAARQA